jgi:membrane protein YqaA with SNARE-associated domain
METFAFQYGYLGIFLISLLGAASIFVPIPSSAIIFIMGGSSTLEPLWIAVAAGLGAVLGEFSGYLVGMSGRRIISDKYKRKMEILTKLFKRYGSIIIFLFALTPLPDDLLFIPLGVMRFGIVRTFLPALLGKFLSNLLIAYAGQFSIQIIRDIFGVESEGIALLIMTIIAAVLLAIVFVIMFKVDWEKRAEKFLNERNSSDGKTAKATNCSLMNKLEMKINNQHGDNSQYEDYR